MYKLRYFIFTQYDLINFTITAKHSDQKGSSPGKITATTTFLLFESFTKTMMRGLLQDQLNRLLERREVIIRQFELHLTICHKAYTLLALQ